MGDSECYCSLRIRSTCNLQLLPWPVLQLAMRCLSTHVLLHLFYP